MTYHLSDTGSFRVKEFLQKDSQKIVFVFTAMGTKIGIYGWFIQALRRKGYSVVIYDYPLHVILDPAINSWSEFVDTVVTNAETRLALYKQNGYVDFYAYGVSMGTLLASRLAQDSVEINHVVLNLTYGDVADNIWTYRGVRKAKQKWLSLGVDREKLRELVADFDPIATAHRLQGKKVLLYLSRQDRVIVYAQSQFTKKAFEDAALDLQYVENKYLGHYFGAVKNMLGINRLDKFYRS